MAVRQTIPPSPPVEDAPVPHASVFQAIGKLIAAPLLSAAIVSSLVATASAAAPSAPSLPARGSLHVEIDRLLDAERLSPAGAPADDLEFLRRATLDLHGIIPTVDEARTFLADKSPDKRTKLVDALLASPRFARHMATTYDVLLNERRADKIIKHGLWYEFLYSSFLDGKPYDRMVREILLADDSKEELKPASKFFHDRDCEPNVMTRDIGRLFFGMDMQCNQCHDHPVIDDYSIGDYYGLYAFVGRTILHTDAKTKTKVIAEKADGEASYKSVFTGESADKVAMKLPRGVVIDEPKFAKGEEYAVKPEKGAKPVPKFSRRAKLAEAATDGTNEMFARNGANRLWAHLFGRGLVHPVDFIHPDNPPTHPAVLDLITREFKDRKYDVRSLLRELMLTQAYQRTFVLPAADKFAVGQAAKRLATWQAELKDLEAQLAKTDAKHEAEVRRLKTLVNARKQHVAEAELVVAYEKTAKADPKSAGKAWEGLVAQWTERGDVPLLRPLPPEVFCDSIMQVGGLVAVNEQKAESALKKALPKEIAQAKPEDRPQMQAVWLDKQTFEPLRTNYARFVELYGVAAGADFAATINQALFFGNSGTIDGWLKPSGANLASQLAAMTDAAGLADEMYLAVFTRRPTDVERADVAAYLKGRDKDRAAAVQEMLWAMLSSNEFRFNH
jgi:hypothetical protein